jgi:hypothetical protein
VLRVLSVRLIFHVGCMFCLSGRLSCCSVTTLLPYPNFTSFFFQFRLTDLLASALLHLYIQRCRPQLFLFGIMTTLHTFCALYVDGAILPNIFTKSLESGFSKFISNGSRDLTSKDHQVAFC